MNPRRRRHNRITRRARTRRHSRFCEWMIAIQRPFAWRIAEMHGEEAGR